MRLKSLHFYIIIVYALLNLNKEAYGQCPPGSTLQTLAYNVAYPPATQYEKYYLPQFDPSLGTLIGVNFDLTTDGYTMLQLINGDPFPTTFTDIEFKRKDRITLPGRSPIVLHDSTVNYPDITLQASDNPTPAPPYSQNGSGHPKNYWWGDAYTPPLGTEYHATIPANEFSNYTGDDDIEIIYGIYPQFTFFATGSHVSSAVVTMATNVNMTITYTYCTNSILPIDKLDFFAKTADGDNIALSWTKEYEDNNIIYGIEMSTNGLDFTTVGSMQSQKPEKASTIVKYEYDYKRPAGINSKLYFRVKQTDAEGKIRYSSIKWVDTKNELQAKFTLYPNPASNEVTLQFKTPQQNSIQVQLINSMGQTVQTTRINTAGSSLGSLRFNSKYAPGVYFIKAIDDKTKEQQVSRLIIK